MAFLGVGAREWFLALDLFVLALSGGCAAWLFLKLRRAERLALRPRPRAPLARAAAAPSEQERAEQAR